MPTFEYRAKNATGEAVNGTAFGISMDHVMRDLGSKGLQIVSIGVATNPGDPLADAGSSPRYEIPKTAGERGSIPVVEAPPTGPRSYMETSVWGPLAGKVPLKDLAFFFRQLSTMLDAGVPIVQSVNTLAKQAQNGNFKEILTELVRHVETGNRLSDCMQRYPEVFTPVMLSLVRAGEQGGFLDRALAIVADYLDREIQLRNLYRRVTFYPKMEVALSIIIIIVANLILSSIGSKNQLNSPLTNPATWIILTPLIILAFLFFRVGLANHAVKTGYDEFVARLPGIGTTYRQLSMAKFGRAFGAMHKAGVPLSKNLTLSADACGNEYLRAKMYPAYKRLEEGVGVAEAFRETGAFTPVLMDMVATGETSGNLEMMMGKVADYYEDEATTRSMQLAQVVGVLLGLAVAVYIGYIVIGFWTGYGATYSNATQQG